MFIVIVTCFYCILHTSMLKEVIIAWFYTKQANTLCGTDDWTQRPMHARLSLSFFSLLNHSNTLFCESVSLNFPSSHLVASFLSLSSTWATKLLFFFLSFFKITFIYVSIYLFTVWGLCVRVCVWVSVCVCVEVRGQLVGPGSFLTRGGSQN